MNDFSAGQLCFALEEFVNAMGMQAENAYRVSIGQSPAYGEEAFGKVAASISNYGSHILQGQ